MKKLAIGIGFIFLIALAMPALANNAAVVGPLVNPPCEFSPGIDGLGNVFATNSLLVVNGNNWILTCRGQITDKFPKKVFTYEGTVGCYIDSDYFRVVVTPGGQATMTCLGTFK